MSKKHLQAIINLGYTLSVYYVDEINDERIWEVRRSTDVDEVVDAVNNVEGSYIMVHKDRKVTIIHYLDQGCEDECIVDYSYKEEWHDPSHEHYDLLAILECASVEELEEHLGLQKKETNIEFVSRLMNFSKVGGLQQMFILAAIDVYSQHVQKQDEPIKNQMGFIDPKAWKACADEIQTELAKRNS